LGSRQVFEAVHREIDTFLSKGMFDLDNEYTIASYLSQGRMRITVACGVNLLNNYVQGRPLLL
jgi:hypothetical protein